MEDYYTALIGVGGTILGTILGFVLSEVVSFFKRRADKKERFLLSNFNLRQQAYANIYIALEKYQKYFYQFIDYCNEFVEHKELEEFAPISDLTELMNTYDSNKIWIHKKSMENIQKVIDQSSLLCNLAICNHGDNSTFLNEVQPSSLNMIDLIETAKEHIRQISGMDELDKLSDKYDKCS